MKSSKKSTLKTAGVVFGLLALGFISWIIYQQVEIKPTNDSDNRQQEQTAKVIQESSDPAQDTPGTAIEIDEWGLATSYSQPQIKIRYQVSGNTIRLTENTVYQNHSDGIRCDYGDLGIIERYLSDEILPTPMTGEDAITAEQFFDNNPPDTISWKKLNRHYYMFHSPHAACTDGNDDILIMSIKAGKEMTENLETLD